MKIFKAWMLLFAVSASADQARIEKSDPSLSGLKWDNDIADVESNPGAHPIALLKGEFELSNWGLIWNENKILSPLAKKESAARPFTLRVPLTGEVTSLELIAVGPNGEVQKQKIHLRYQEKNQHGWYKHARIAGFVGYQPQSKGSSFSWEVSWNPIYSISNTWALQGNLGATLLKSLNSGSRFLALDYAISLAYRRLEPWSFELGGGAQTWASNGGTAPQFLIGATKKVSIQQKYLSLIDRIVMGYAAYFHSIAIVHEGKLGVGLTF